MAEKDGWAELEDAAARSEVGAEEPTDIERLEYARCLARPELLPNIRLPILKDDVLNQCVHIVCQDEFGSICGELVSLKDREPILQPKGLLTNPSKCKILLYFAF